MVSKPLNSGGTHPILAYLITETLRSNWHESQKRVEFLEQAQSVPEQLIHELSNMNGETDQQRILEEQLDL